MADITSKKGMHAHESMRVAFLWSLVWITTALIFNILLWYYLYLTVDPFTAKEKALNFFAGYIIEKSLSIDNLFVFYIIFHQFHIPPQYQQRIFSYGIWGAIVLRLLLILLGSWLIMRFHWILYLMGAFLIFTGFKMGVAQEKEADLTKSKTFGFLKKCFRMTEKIEGPSFFIKQNKLNYATPLFVALIFIEIADIIFALDSIPAIFAITTDPFIVWSSNIFAILGLRSLYFLLAGMIRRLHLLKYAISLILVFVGLKMVLEPWINISVEISLTFIISTLLLFGVMSWLNQKGS